MTLPITFEIKQFPRTASKEVIHFLKSGRIEEKLSQNPSVFLKFVQQAYQDSAFFYREVKLMVYSFSILTHMAITRKVPMNAVVKAVDLIVKFHKRSILGSGDVFFTHGKDQVALNRLFLLPYFSVLRERWLKNPMDTHLSIRDFLPKESTDEHARFILNCCLSDLYLTLFALPLESFIRYEAKAVYLLIHFCRNTGYEIGYKGLQKVFCAKITDFKMALEEYVNAKKNKFEIVEEFCRKFLDELEIYESYTHCRKSYVATTFLIDGNFINGNLDFRRFTKGFLDYHQPILNAKIVMFLIHFLPVSPQAMMLNCESFDIATFSKKDKIKTANPLKLGDLPLEHLIINGQSLMCTAVYAGLFLFFKKVLTLSFSQMKGFPESLIKELSTIRPDIDCLTVSNPEALSVRDVEGLRNSFDKITKIGFCYTKVTKEIFTAIFTNKNICKLELAHSTFELPDDSSLLSRLVQLEIMFNNEVPRAIFNRLTQAAVNVRILCLTGNKEYSLSDYPYPLNICEITGFFEHLNAEKQVFRKFRNLRSLRLLNVTQHIGQLIPFLPPDIKITMADVVLLK